MYDLTSRWLKTDDLLLEKGGFRYAAEITAYDCFNN